MVQPLVPACPEAIKVLELFHLFVGVNLDSRRVADFNALIFIGVYLLYVPTILRIGAIIQTHKHCSNIEWCSKYEPTCTMQCTHRPMPVICGAWKSHDYGYSYSVDML